VRGPWNQGESSQLGETWQYVQDPIRFVLDSNGLTTLEPQGTSRTLKGTEDLDAALSKERGSEIDMAVPLGPQAWSESAKAAEMSNGKNK
jgi:Mn-containing catalase